MDSGQPASPLTKYPRPNAAVDVVVLTYRDGELAVVTVDRPSGPPALPGTFVRPGERFVDAARRGLATKTPLRDVPFDPIGMFDEPDRDDRGWVVSLAHVAAVPSAAIPRDVHLVPIDGDRPTTPLAYDHAAMVTAAVHTVRTRYARAADPAGLLGDTFTVSALRRLYEVLFDRPLQKDSFRRHVTSALVPTGAMSSPGTGRPAELFARAGDAALPAQAGVLLTG